MRIVLVCVMRDGQSPAMCMITEISRAKGIKGGSKTMSEEVQEVMRQEHDAYVYNMLI